MDIDLDIIINAANYEKICDFSIIPPENKIFNNNIIEKNSIIFCKTDFINYLFENLKNSTKKHVLVTHHSDYPIDQYKFSLKPKSIIKWFAINATFTHPDLISIPLGIKTHSGCYLEKQYMTEWFAKSCNNLRDIKKSKNIYCNWNLTNLARNNILQKLLTNNVEFTYENNLSFDSYATSLAQHKFVISPPGNGIDCHRTWESLYVGSIPIVIKNKIYDSWSDLPIIQVNDYSEVTNDMLEKFVHNNTIYDKLLISYWKKMIKGIL